MHSKVNQLYIYTYPLFLRFFSHIGHYRVLNRVPCAIQRDFPGGSVSKASVYNEGDPGLIPGWGRSPGEGNGNPLQYSCPENLMDRGAWWATVHRVTKSQTQLSIGPY